jgi:hypothetical protein
MALPYAVAALLALLFLVRFYDPDVFWHLATGRYIVEHHAIPRVDPFSFTVLGEPWRTIDWLAELALYGAYAAFGYPGLGLFNVLWAFTMLAALATTLRELGVRSSLTVSVLVCTALLVQPRYSMGRPMEVGAALLSLSLLMATRFWRRGGRGLYALVPLVGVWSLVHPSALLGVAIAGAVATAALLADRTRLRVAGTVLALCVAALVASPDGRGVLFHTGSLERFPLALALTIEWKRSSLGDPALWVPAAFCGFGLVAGLLRFRALLPLCCAGLLGFFLGARYVRNSFEAVLLCAPLVGAGGEMLAAWLERRGLSIAALALPAVVALVPGLHLAVAPGALNTDFGVGPSGALVPKQTLALLRTLPPGHTIHDCSLGGYLIWERVPVYCDGRAIALYSEADVERLFLPLYEGGAALERVSDRYAIHYALARPDTDFERALMRSPAWVPLGFDRESTLFVRRALLPQDGVVPLDELRYVSDTPWLEAYYRAHISDPAGFARFRAELRRAVAISSDSPTLRAVVVFVGRMFPAYREPLAQAVEPAH